jgi:hypothetical protein
LVAVSERRKIAPNLPGSAVDNAVGITNAAEAAAICAAHWAFAPHSGTVIANPPPAEWAIPAHEVEAIIAASMLDAAREVVSGDALAATAGVTSTHASVVVLRLLARRVEPAMALLARVRSAWRREAWALEANPPRIWRM